MTLWLPRYSPLRVRFWLAHAAELDALAESPASSRHLRAYLAHEWALVAADPHHRACLCPLGEPTPPETLGRSEHASGWHAAQDLRADLHRAADRLPVTWLVAREVAQALGREGRWGWRYCQRFRLSGAFPLAPVLDGRPTIHDAARTMASALGWRQPVDESPLADVS